jgi:hypothetical protein
MNVLVIGGYSQRNQQWTRELTQALSHRFDKAVFLDYRHWNEEVDLDLIAEIGRAKQLAAGLGEYVLVAKSIGSALSILGCATHDLQPKRCVLMGLPLAHIKSELPEVANAITILPPTIFIHNESDPVAPASEVREYLDEFHPEEFELVVDPGNETHDYLDFSFIEKCALGES